MELEKIEEYLNLELKTQKGFMFARIVNLINKAKIAEQKCKNTKLCDSCLKLINYYQKNDVSKLNNFVKMLNKYGTFKETQLYKGAYLGNIPEKLKCFIFHKINIIENKKDEEDEFIINL